MYHHHHHHHHPRISSRRKSWNKTSGPLRKHRDQILIGSLVNSKQVNGRALQKDTFTARLLLYVYVAYPLPPPPKNSPGLHQSQEWYLAKVRWTCPPQSTPWRRPWAGQIGFLSSLTLDRYRALVSPTESTDLTQPTAIDYLPSPNDKAPAPIDDSDLSPSNTDNSPFYLRLSTDSKR